MNRSSCCRAEVCNVYTDYDDCNNLQTLVTDKPTLNSLIRIQVGSIRHVFVEQPCVAVTQALSTHQLH